MLLKAVNIKGGGGGSGGAHPRSQSSFAADKAPGLTFT